MRKVLKGKQAANYIKKVKDCPASYGERYFKHQAKIWFMDCTGSYVILVSRNGNVVVDDWDHLHELHGLPATGTVGSYIEYAFWAKQKPLKYLE